MRINQMSDKEYQRYVNKKTPNSPLGKDLCHAFLVGGAICVIGQLIRDGYTAWFQDTETAQTLTSVTLVFLGALFTGIGIYDDLARFAGAGSIVPITGFANAVASPAMEFKAEGLVLGLSVKLFTVAGPVIVYGTVASVLVGIYFYVCNLIGLPLPQL